jgi:hypothetical protein
MELAQEMADFISGDKLFGSVTTEPKTQQRHNIR